MSIDICVGLCGGDEGKGRIVDVMSSSGKYDIIARFNGSSNAGHTIKLDNTTYKLHMLPSGVLNKNVINIICAGVYFNPKEFLEEKKNVEKQSNIESIVYVSDKCQVVLPHHIDFNKIEENRLGKNLSGSTCRGTTSCAVDFVNKSGIRVCDLFGEEDILLEKIKRQYSIKVALSNFYKQEEKTIDNFFITSPEDTLKEIISYKDELKKYISNVEDIFQNALKNKHNILFEGQLGFIKDQIFGQYPEISSSSCIAAQACVSSGIPVNSDIKIIGVLKAYETLVGKGFMPTELHGEEAHELREINGEYGATSGRPRRVAWANMPSVRKAIEINGCDEIALTLLDVLGYYDEIPVCVRYTDTRTMKAVYDFPITNDLEHMSPVYYYLEGWKEDISNCRTWDSLPKNARKYVEFIENQIGMKIRYISVGPNREEMIDRESSDKFKYYSPETIEGLFNIENNEWKTPDL